MEKLYRIVDANVNRASEGLRILEDMARFYYDDKTVSSEIKKLRHGIRKGVMEYMPQLLVERNSDLDVGFATSKELALDGKASMAELAAANFKRIQEALRTIEESLKVLNKYPLSKQYEEYRFQTYSLEKVWFGRNTLEAKRQKLQSPLYCLTAEQYSCGRSNIEVVRAMIDSGVGIIQYREKEKKLVDKYQECVEIRKMTAERGVAFIVNDDIDIALMVKADGVHIGQDDLPIEKVREVVGPEMIIGLSTHSPEQAQDAIRRGADYIGVGPIYKTYTKKDVCDPVGLDYLEYAVKHVDIPFVAIGGIKEHNMHEVVSRGARCIAMVTEIVGADDIGAKIRDVMEKINF